MVATDMLLMHNGYYLVKVAPPKERSRGGVILAASSKRREPYGTVVNTPVKGKLNLDIHEEDLVYFSTMGAYRIGEDHENLMVVHEEDILGVVAYSDRKTFLETLDKEAVYDHADSDESVRHPARQEPRAIEQA